MSITGVWPELGPVSGGTILAISGNHLNVGSHVSIFLDSLPCIFNKTRSSSHRIICVTTRATFLSTKESVTNGGNEPGTTAADEHKKSFAPPFLINKLVVTIDGAERTLDKPFTYMPDPFILELKPLRSPWSGGRLLTVHGRHFNSIQAPKITVLLEDNILNSSLCMVISPSQMECPSPSVDMQTVHALLRERRELNERHSQERQKSSHKVSR